MSGETAKPSLGDLEDLPVQEGMRDGSYSPSLAPDPVEPVDVEKKTSCCPVGLPGILPTTTGIQYLWLVSEESFWLCAYLDAS